MNIEFDITSYLRLNPIDMLIICISTFIIVVIAKKFFWDKVLAFLDARHDAIQSDLEEAANAKKAAEDLKQQYNNQMASARKEAFQMIEHAKETAKEEKKELLAKAKEEAAGLKAKAMQEIEREKVQAQKEMKQAIADVAFTAAEKIVEAELSEEQQKKYVDDFIASAGDDKWQQ